MAFSTKVIFVPRDNRVPSVSIDNVNYGLPGNTNIFDSVKNEYAFLNFREIWSSGYYDFVATLTFEEFVDFHKKYYKDETRYNTDQIEKFLSSIPPTMRYNWVLVVVYEWESGLD